MKLDLFPPVYKSELDVRTQQIVSQEQSRSKSQQNTIRNNTGSKPDSFMIVIGTGFVGFVIGFFICCANCESPKASDSLLPWFLWTIGALIVGGIIAAAINKSYEESVRTANYNANNEAKNSEKMINQVRASAEQEYANYVANFESSAQQMSVQFAESQLAIEVIDWMTTGYTKTIDSADRRSHIESVNIPFVFNVYTNRITCNLGTFDFEIKRCRNLNGPLEQTALARAIASAIQLNITMKYPKDISGTDIVTNISYSYGNDFVSATLIYTAANGNYRAVRDWN